MGTRGVFSLGTGTLTSFVEDSDLQSILEHLECTSANMTEFVLLLMGCERICRRPEVTLTFTQTLLCSDVMLRSSRSSGSC
ncbi:hypothetical protein EJB05_23069, partial [Eragrostis curvula]